MLKVVVLFLLGTLLNAQNPPIYISLADEIYDNAENIERLKDISEYSKYEKKIDTYIQNLYKTKDIGYAIEAGDKSIDKEEYLAELRELSIINNFFHRKVLDSFKLSIINEDSELFSQTINSGFIDTKIYKKEIIEYYNTHSSDIDASGVIQAYLDEDKKFKKLQELSKSSRTKARIQEAKIKRIRLNDKKKQEALQKNLEDELFKTKSDIRQKQKDELVKPN